YRCKDCFSNTLFCVACIVEVHNDNPLHWIEIWKEGEFESLGLKSLGLRIQLGHGRHGKCSGTMVQAAQAGQEKRRDDLVIVDSNGIHEVGLDFCTCVQAQVPVVQLLHARLYPATTTNPSSAATFRVLRKFHIQSFELKCSAYEFHNSHAQETNNTGNFQHRV
ncbi:hypothetical protein B0H10DRAFT_1663009, partial [Mycena sp. CBHHK59/15]